MSFPGNAGHFLHGKVTGTGPIVTIWITIVVSLSLLISWAFSSWEAAINVSSSCFRKGEKGLISPPGQSVENAKDPVFGDQ
jgi:hypothetical protein